VEKGIAQPLEPFIAKEKDFSKEGYHKAMLDIGTYNGKVYSLPFAVSLPISYYNLDLVKKAGGDPNQLPRTWDEVISLAKKIDALGKDTHGLFFGWNITGNWLWQALNFSQGGAMLTPDEKKVAFDGPIGKWSIKTFARFKTEANMPNLGSKDCAQVFAAGKVGMFFWSTSILARMTEWVGDKFVLKTGPYPSVKNSGGLPAGGNGVVMLTKDTKKQAAAWKFIKFATSGQGAAVVAKTTGYMPPNKKANEVYLKDFYQKHPNHMAAVKQLPLLTNWYAFPGKNGLKITKVIYDDMESIVSGEKADKPMQVLASMVRDTQKLLPK
jgi:multiple sugar transport system substrate-binding protein